MIDNIKIGDFVTRILAGCIEMQLKVTDLTENKVVCGSWEFCRQTGLEMDDELEWGPAFGKSGSYLKEITPTIRHIRYIYRSSFDRDIREEDYSVEDLIYSYIRYMSFDDYSENNKRGKIDRLSTLVAKLVQLLVEKKLLSIDELGNLICEDLVNNSNWKIL